MKVNYDKESDVLYIGFRDGKIQESDEQRPGVIFDYDASGNVLGIEVLGASKIVEKPFAVELGAERTA